MSCLGAAYGFIQAHREERAVLWPAVRRELRWAVSLLPLVRRDLAAEWGSTVMASDASLWGRGVVESERPVGLIRRAGRVNER